MFDQNVDAVIGLNYGDESKGKFTDYLANTGQYKFVARYSGGGNAGHTIYRNNKKTVLHHLPVGVMYPSCKSILGTGMVIEPTALLKEMQEIKDLGYSLYPNNLFISGKAHITLPFYQNIDKDRDKTQGIGTTGKGIGITYELKARRLGIRMEDLKSEDICQKKLNALQEAFPSYLPFANMTLLSQYNKALTPFICDTEDLLWQNRKEAVLCEGAQAASLDLDQGFFPYVTSSNCGVGGIINGLGIPPQRINKVFGVIKAYNTRVGSGPFISEAEESVSAKLRELGGEYGATTGRPRRCGWLDIPETNRAIRLNGVTDVVMAKVDVLVGYGNIPVCIRHEDKDNKPAYAEYSGIETATKEAYNSYASSLEFMGLEQKISFISHGKNLEDVYQR